jgi:uncharacterized membrane protein YidH (DUF202 family)
MPLGQADMTAALWSASMQSMSMESQEPHSPKGGGFDQVSDATRRTRLANERTYLAWWRTGLASAPASSFRL